MGPDPNFRKVKRKFARVGITGQLLRYALGFNVEI